MAQSQVATPVPDVGKLRPVLDYMPCETCLDMYTPEQDYYCAICPRLVRDIVVRRSALGTDEAVQVIAAEDFSMAKDLRDRIQSQELELQDAREKLAAVAKREMDLQAELSRLQDDLARARKDRDDAQLIPFEFVGVREGQREEGLMEFGEEDQPPRRLGAHQPTALAWEPAPEESGQPTTDWQSAAPEPAPTPETQQPTATTWEEIPEDADESAAPTTEEQEPVEASEPAETPSFESTEELPPPSAPPPRPMPAATPTRMTAAPTPTTDDAIARIEAEIAKIEQELQQVAEQEKQLGGAPKPKKKKK